MLLKDYQFPGAEGNTESVVHEEAPATDEAQAPAESSDPAPE